MKKILAALTLTALAGITLSSMPVLAEKKEMDDGGYFDAEFYAKEYPDVAALLGTDEAVLYQHYLQCGKAEGRLPYQSENAGPAEAVSGNGANIAVMNPAIDHNYKLGLYARDGVEGAAFDHERYAKDYPEIPQMVGTSHKGLWEHYKNYGIYEGRRAQVSLSGNDDLLYSKDTALSYLSTTNDLDLVKRWMDTNTRWADETVSDHLVDYYSEKDVQAYIDICDIASSIVTVDMTTEEKIRACCEWICQHTTYGMAPDGGKGVYSLLYNGTAISHGYAVALDAFMAAIGVPCNYIQGYPQETGFHAWNSVCVDYIWYDIDVTWMDIYTERDNRPDVAAQYYMIPHETGAFAARNITMTDN